MARVAESYRIDRAMRQHADASLALLLGSLDGVERTAVITGGVRDADHDALSDTFSGEDLRVTADSLAVDTPVDLAIVPDFVLLGESWPERAWELKEKVGPSGRCVLGLWQPVDREMLEGLRSELLGFGGSLRLFGQLCLSASAFAELGKEHEDFEVALGASGQQTVPDRYVFVWSAQERDGALSSLPGQAVVGRAQAPEESRGEAPPPQTLSSEEKLSQRELQAQSDIDRIEMKLQELAYERTVWKRRSEQRDDIVRELLGRLESADFAGSSSHERARDVDTEALERARYAAVERALDAEAARAELQFRVDELELALVDARRSRPPAEIAEEAQYIVAEERSRRIGLEHRAFDNELALARLLETSAEWPEERARFRAALEEIQEQHFAVESELTAAKARMQELELERIQSGEREKQMLERLREARRVIEELGARADALSKESENAEQARQTLESVRSLLTHLGRY